jgi:L-alanine-DL-glutamate epimerase-like enolase superfamily enzyme
VLRTDDEDGLEGHALAFTTGRGNDNQANAIGALADHVVGTRAIEFVDHLHEHLVTPVVVRDGHDVAPRALGLGAQLHPQSLADHRLPDGPVWRD